MADARRTRVVQQPAVKSATLSLLVALGYDPSDPALVDTPGRVARAWSELLDADAGNTDRVFHVERSDEMVVLRGITGWSFCEHHLLPFSYDATVAYVPAAGVIVGLSKLARMVRKHGAALQLQERLASQVADEVEATTKATGVAVRITGVHLCTVMRGVRAEQAEFITTVVRGTLRAPAARAEFLAAAEGRQAR